MKNLIIVLVLAFAFHLNATASIVKTSIFNVETDSVRPKPPVPPVPPVAPKAPKEKKMTWIDKEGKEPSFMAHKAVFISENGDTTKPKSKEVRIEREIENGVEKTRIWVDGKELDQNSDEFKKLNAGEKKIFKSDDGSMMIFKEERKIEVETDDNDDDMSININVEDLNNGKKKIIIVTEDSKEEIIIADTTGTSSKVFKTDDGKTIVIKQDADFTFEGDKDSDVETVKVEKTPDGETITIRKKDGEVITHVVKKSETVKVDKRIKKDKKGAKFKEIRVEEKVTKESGN
jgi:hypothetical protein